MAARSKGGTRVAEPDHRLRWLRPLEPPRAALHVADPAVGQRASQLAHGLLLVALLREPLVVQRRVVQVRTVRQKPRGQPLTLLLPSRGALAVVELSLRADRQGADVLLAARELLRLVEPGRPALGPRRHATALEVVCPLRRVPARIGVPLLQTGPQSLGELCEVVHQQEPALPDTLPKHRVGVDEIVPEAPQRLLGALAELGVGLVVAHWPAGGRVVLERAELRVGLVDGAEGRREEHGASPSGRIGEQSELLLVHVPEELRCHGGPERWVLHDGEVLLDVSRTPELAVSVGLDARRDVPHDPDCDVPVYGRLQPGAQPGELVKRILRILVDSALVAHGVDDGVDHEDDDASHLLLEEATVAIVRHDARAHRTLSVQNIADVRQPRILGLVSCHVQVIVLRGIVVSQSAESLSTTRIS
mmetsp:Transcript_67023/g.174466  ORF Transcript_67023/g.174466 Transcript_67023/m.174466 type:complete len:419 (-) Transcript_67023:639-1895(-)